MAKAKATKVTVVEVTLELSGEEAAILVEIACKIGGPKTGPRGMMDEIRDVLEDIGIQRYGGGNCGAIRFD